MGRRKGPLAQVTKNRNAGYAEERKTAKELSWWMFQDKEVLKRHPREGADKKTWRGDVIPWKPIPWDIFPFYIEVKKGYEDFKPTFWKYSIIEDWFRKAVRLGFPKNQKIILLCLQFHNMAKLFCTNRMLNPCGIVSKVIVPIIDEEGCGHYLFCYLYKDVLKIDFNYFYNMQSIIEEIKNE